jgi:calcineurin-like phosphoesterase family protein
MNLPGVYKIFNDKWDGYQTVWIFSDCHFNDKDLRAGIRNRPSDEELVRRINAKVGKKDVLILLGDCGDPSFVRQLRGYKVLVAGNHEPGLSAFDEIFQEIYSGPVMIGEKIILSHEPIPNLNWAMNIHGHNHNKYSKNDANHFNVCSDVIGYEPINFNQWLKGGHMAKVQTLHRQTIDSATIRKQKRGGKKYVPVSD